MIVIARIGEGTFLRLDNNEYKISINVARNLMKLGINVKYEYRNKEV